MPYIYKITNSVNDKVYIGQTKASVEERWTWHLRAAGCENAPYKSKLYSAMRKYGRDKFSIEVIEECSIEDLNEREKYWIAKFDSKRNGYNITTGGDGFNVIDDYEEKRILALWKDGKTQNEIYEITGRYIKGIRRILLQHGVTRKEIHDRCRKTIAEQLSKPVYAYNLNGEFVAEYESCGAAALATGVHKTTIGHIIHGREESSNGLTFRYCKQEKIEFERTVRPRNKEVFQYTLDGMFVAAFPSYISAARAVGINDGHTIASSCKNHESICGGYQWRSFKADKIEPADLSDGRHLAAGGKRKYL